MKNIPKKIYLNISSEIESFKQANEEQEAPKDFNNLEHEFVFWSTDHNDKSDLEYILKSEIDLRILEIEGKRQEALNELSTIKNKIKILEEYVGLAANSYKLTGDKVSEADVFRMLQAKASELKDKLY